MVEKDEAVVQIKVDGGEFDPWGGIDIRLPASLDLQFGLRRAADL